jgi:Flp pilus assembly pilin Flp
LQVRITEIWQNECGQGIVEYAAGLAFVAMLIAAMLNQKAPIANAISAAMSSITAQVQQASGGS